jgi:hypothetical protein
MAKRKAGSQIDNLTPDHKKLRIAPISYFAGGVRCTIEKLSTKAITLLHTSFQLKVCTQSYGLSKLRKSQFWEFRDSHLGILGQNDIRVLVSWPSTKYIIRGKVVASPKSGPW